MIFTPEHCDMIMRGEKTQTRRIIKPGHAVLNGWRLPLGVGRVGTTNDINGIAIVQNNGRDMWQIHNTYALQPGRGKTAVGRIRITAIHIESGVQCIHDDEAIAEGLWKEGDCWRSALDMPGDCISTARGAYARVWDSINTRKGTRWADNPAVWVLTFELMADNLDSEG